VVERQEELCGLDCFHSCHPFPFLRRLAWEEM
jgi:hypothetical protein